MPLNSAGHRVSALLLTRNSGEGSVERHDFLLIQLVLSVDLVEGGHV